MPDPVIRADSYTEALALIEATDPAVAATLRSLPDGTRFRVTRDPLSLIIGDPASLYVCRAEAETPHQMRDRRACDDAMALAYGRAAHLPHAATVVAGSAAPWFRPAHPPISAETADVVREIRRGHLTAPIAAIGDPIDHLDDPEFGYNADAYGALLDVIPADRAPWR